MQLKIGFDEAQDYVLSKYNVNISLSKAGDREISISLTKKVFIKTVQVNVALHIHEVSNESILISYTSGFGVDKIISGVISFIEKKYPEYGRIITAESGNRLRVHLSQIEKLRKPLSAISLRDINFDDSNMIVYFTLKDA